MPNPLGTHFSSFAGSERLLGKPLNQYSRRNKLAYNQHLSRISRTIVLKLVSPAIWKNTMRRVLFLTVISVSFGFSTAVIVRIIRGRAASRMDRARCRGRRAVNLVQEVEPGRAARWSRCGAGRPTSASRCGHVPRASELRVGPQFRHEPERERHRLRCERADWLASAMCSPGRNPSGTSSSSTPCCSDSGVKCSKKK